MNGGGAHHRLAKEVTLASSAFMPTSVAPIRRRKSPRRRRDRAAVRPSYAPVRPVRLNLDPGELALHAEISAAVARDLGR